MTSGYALLASEMYDPDEASFVADNVRILEEHVGIAAQACANFAELVREKTPLPKGSEDQQLLDKLAEIRAIVGLHKTGFERIRFAKTPDLLAGRAGTEYSIEVSRLGPITGRLSNVWEEEHSVAEGIVVRLTSFDTLPAKLSEAIYSKLEKKARQVPKDGSVGVLWISGSRVYFAVGDTLERSTAGAETRMPHSTRRALLSAAESLRATELYQHLQYIVLSEVERDTFYPKIPR